MSEELFSVALFFPDESYVYEARELTAEAAVKLAKRCTERPAAMIGMIRRVIITDGDENTCFEWKFGCGVTYPERALNPFMTPVRPLTGARIETNK